MVKENFKIIAIPSRCCCYKPRQLSSENANTTGSFNFLFGLFREETCFYDDGLIDEFSFSENFVDAVFGAIDNWYFGFTFMSFSHIFANQRPQVINIDSWTKVLVLLQMEMTRTNFTKVTGMVFIEINSVMMLTTSQTTSTRMLTVFTDTYMTVGNLAAHFTGFASIGRHVVV